LAENAAVVDPSPMKQVVENTAPVAEPKVEKAISVKKRKARQKPQPVRAVEKPLPVKGHQMKMKDTTPKDVAISGEQAAHAQPALMGGDGGHSISGRGSGAGDSAQGVQLGAAMGVNTSGESQPQAMQWNAQSGPRFLRQAPLRYPRSAQRRNLEGKVVIEAHLDPMGKLLRARVLQADYQEFADAALSCIQASSFRPAQREGKAIPCVVRIPMLFMLKGL